MHDCLCAHAIASLLADTYIGTVLGFSTKPGVQIGVQTAVQKWCMADAIHYFQNRTLITDATMQLPTELLQIMFVTQQIAQQCSTYSGA